MSKILFFAIATAIACGLFSIAMAQEGAGNQGGGQPGQNVGVQAANLSAEEQIAAGKAIVERGERLSSRVSKMLEDARREADIIRITCLNEKLTQINANLRNAQKRVESLAAAVDPETRKHEYTVLSVLDQKFSNLDQEANQCLGQEIFETGATRVETEVDTSVVPDEKPTITPPSMPTPPVIPQPASGTY